MLFWLFAAAAPGFIALDATTHLDQSTISGPATRRTAMVLSVLADQDAAIVAQYAANCRTGRVWIVRTALTTSAQTVDGPPELRGRTVNGPNTPRIRRLLCQRR